MRVPEKACKCFSIFIFREISCFSISYSAIDKYCEFQKFDVCFVGTGHLTCLISLMDDDQHLMRMNIQEM